MREFKSSLLTLVVTILSLAFTTSVFGWDEVGPKVKGQRYNFSDSYPVEEYCTAVKQNGKWGFVNAEGTLVTPCIYEEIGTPSSWQETSTTGHYRLDRQAIPVKLNGKWGYVGQNGKEKIKPKYDKVGQFHTESYMSGYETKYKGVAYVVEKGVRKAINHKGKEEKNPEYLNVIERNGVSYYQKRDGNWTTSGNMSAPKYDSNYLYISDYYGIQALYDIRNGKWLECDKTDRSIIVGPEGKGVFGNNRIILEPKYKEVRRMNGTDRFIVSDGRYEGLYDENGKELIPIAYQKIESADSGNNVVVSSGGKKGIYAIGFGMKLSPQYDYIEPIGDNYIFKDGGKCGLLDTNGRVILQPEYKNINDFDSKSGLIWLCTAPNSYDLYSITQKKVLISNVESLGSYIYGRGTNVKIGGKWGLMNDTGNLILPAIYSHECEMRKGTPNEVYIYENSKIGVAEIYNGVAKVLVPCGHFSSIYSYEPGFIIGTKDNKIGAYCMKGGVFTPMVAGNSYNVSGDKIVFQTKGNPTPRQTMYCYDNYGNLVSSFNFTGNMPALAAWCRKYGIIY